MKLTRPEVRYLKCFYYMCTRECERVITHHARMRVGKVYVDVPTCDAHTPDALDVLLEFAEDS